MQKTTPPVDNCLTRNDLSQAPPLLLPVDSGVGMRRNSWQKFPVTAMPYVITRDRQRCSATGSIRLSQGLVQVPL